MDKKLGWRERDSESIERGREGKSKEDTYSGERGEGDREGNRESARVRKR